MTVDKSYIVVVLPDGTAKQRFVNTCDVDREIAVMEQEYQGRFFSREDMQYQATGTGWPDSQFALGKRRV